MHIVVRSEAHDSGLCAAPPERKREFARDIRNLTLSALHLNRNLKGAKDAADWTLDENRCWFAWRVIDVRRAYSLTIDRCEADALDAIFATCPESSQDTQPACLPLAGRGRSIVTTKSRRNEMKKAIRLIMVGMLCMVLVSQEQEKADEEGKCGGWLKKCDTNKNGKITCAEARACGLKTPIVKDHPAYACMNDRDGDGMVCE